MLTTPEKIRTLQRKLYRKAKQEPACRFHALYDKVYRVDILSHAYALVRANKGSAGIDGITFAAIEAEEAPIMEVDKDGTKRNVGGGKGNRKGTPQGGVISPLPLLSNLYLHLLDRIWERNNLQQRLGARIVRYADDIVILCRKNKTNQTMAVLRQILERLELTLNETKTKRVNAYEGKFDFLGFEIWIGKSRRTGNHYAHVQPSKKSLKTIKDRVTTLTRRGRTLVLLDRVVKEVNSTLRGWVGYFHKKVMIDHTQLCKFRSSLSFVQQVNLSVYILHYFKQSGRLGESHFHGVDSTELANDCKIPLASLEINGKKIRI